MAGKNMIIYFSRADENDAVGYIEKGNTEIVAEYGGRSRNERYERLERIEALRSANIAEINY